LNRQSAEWNKLAQIESVFLNFERDLGSPEVSKLIG
jgi:hypothetical protein